MGKMPRIFQDHMPQACDARLQQGLLRWTRKGIQGALKD